mmetsp:Transcript_80464/g.120930  ORF Transcript_80464/g.120930 Transcript_80464/m.120930 type:complete len:134 (-) Transcript_80464:499-900(-)
MSVKAASFSNRDASRIGEETCPSHAANHLSMDGRTSSLSSRSSNGATRARNPSIQGAFSIQSSKRGSFCFSELISVNDDKNALGIDQKKHRNDVATMLNNQPVRLAFDGKPTFRQKISPGLPAGSTVMVFAAG